MNFLKNEIASKKRQLDQVTASLSPSPSPDAPPPPKYLKRAELERIEQEQREQERKRREQERREKLYGTKSTTNTTAKKSGAKSLTDAASLATADGATPTSTTGAGVEQIPTPIDGGEGGGPTPGETFFVSNEEAIRRLRQKGQPIRLFAESDKDRRLRLRALELIEDSTTVGQRNEFAKAMEGQELGLELDKVAKRAAGSGDIKGKGKGSAAAVGTPDPDPATAAGSAEDKGKGKGKNADDDVDREPNPKDQDVLVDLDLVRTNPHKVYPQIYHAFKVRRLVSSLGLFFFAHPWSSFLVLSSCGCQARLC